MFLLLLLFVGGIRGDGEKNCTCVPYYQCSEETGFLITDGKGLLDMRGFEKNECTGYFDVCCNISNTVPITTQRVKQQGCGFSGGKNAPWSAALLQQEKTTKMLEYKCSASLIHQRAMLTAAHCIHTDDGLWVARIGPYNVESARIVKHPKFNLGTLQNDIALIILKSPVPLSQQLGLICIPPPSINLDEETCSVNAWRDKPSKRALDSKLVQRSRCQSLLRGTRLGQFFELHESFLCAQGEGTSESCTGDGGSPLVCPVPAQPGRFHQVGIVSWGIGCGEKNTPVVHVNLPLFRDWIDDVMTSNGLNINTYRY